ncbi:hypothetical protein [Methylobacterium variabile]|jgi:hypothetical protein|uniref:hypothetical protein n=1 Tax=Methylobacterium variabile TaxID=298794 RepID=UPI0012EDC257|nr:hypothetical protein [Methylobacterium variabile]
MPVSNETFEKLALRLEGQSEAEFFFVYTYPRYSEPVRQAIADWIASLNDDATSDDLEKLIKHLERYGDYLAKSDHNPYLPNKRTGRSETQGSHSARVGASIP